MGGNEIVLSCRGTQDLFDVATDAKLAIFGNTSCSLAPQRLKEYFPSLRGRDEVIFDKLKEWLTVHTEVKHIVLTGHSLGGEVAARVTKLIKDDKVLANMFKLAVYVNPGMSPYNQDEDWLERLKDPNQKFLLSVGDMVWAGLIDFLETPAVPHAGGVLRCLRDLLSEYTCFGAEGKPMLPVPTDSKVKRDYGITFVTAGKNFEMDYGSGKLKIPAIIQTHNLGCAFAWKNSLHSVPRHHMKSYFRQEQIHLEESLMNRSQTSSSLPVGTNEWVKGIICDRELKTQLLRDLHFRAETGRLSLRAQTDFDTLDDYHEVRNVAGVSRLIKRFLAGHVHQSLRGPVPPEKVSTTHSNSI